MPSRNITAVDKCLIFAYIYRLKLQNNMLKKTTGSVKHSGYESKSLIVGVYLSTVAHVAHTSPIHQLSSI